MFNRPLFGILDYVRHDGVLVLADSGGTKQGPTRLYDPFADAVTAIVDNATGDFDLGWLGSKDRHPRSLAGTR